AAETTSSSPTSTARPVDVLVLPDRRVVARRGTPRLAYGRRAGIRWRQYSRPGIGTRRDRSASVDGSGVGLEPYAPEHVVSAVHRAIGSSATDFCAAGARRSRRSHAKRGALPLGPTPDRSHGTGQRSVPSRPVRRRTPSGV